MASLQLRMVLAAFFLQFLPGAYSSPFTIRNKCSYPVWPGILSSAGTPELSTTGFLRQPGESTSLSVPTSWSGRLWGRTLCTQDSSGQFSCLTGDCSSSSMSCSGGGAFPPATLAEFTLNSAGGLDFYDVSLVDGCNLAMMVAPQGGTGGNVELKIIDGSNEGVACESACDAFGDAQSCCSGAYASPDTCKPSTYSEFFKNTDPQAYSYAYDDGTSTFTCAGADHILTFCPGLSTRLNLIANAARPNPQGSSHYGTIPIVRIPVLENTPAETKPCTYKKFPAETKLRTDKKFPAETDPFPSEKKPYTCKKSPAETKPILHRNRRRLLGKLPDVNVPSPQSTSNEKSWNLDKEDPPSPPAPTGNQSPRH